MSLYVVEMEKVNMSFGGVPVLIDVDFRLMNGEIMGLVGKNGAGKSTLVKILLGVYKPKSGTIKIKGHLAGNNEIIKDREKDISMVFQNFSLIPTMSVLDNVFLNYEPTKNGFINSKLAKKLLMNQLSELQVNININEKVVNLNAFDAQMVEIIKAIIKKRDILILDEPTTSLTDAQIKNLFIVIKKMQSIGISIIFITHYLKILREICDRISILRDGKNILVDDVSNITMDKLVNAISGIGFEKEVKATQTKRYIQRNIDPILKIENLNLKNKVNNISFSLYPGEIIGLAGLLGSGNTDIMHCIYGLNKLDKGKILLKGKEIGKGSPSKSIEYGISLVPDDRQTKGLVLEHSVKANILMSILDKIATKGFFVDEKRSNQIIESYVKKLEIKIKSPEEKVKFLSGGNQQKVVLAKTFATDSTVLLLNDPTFGIDIQTKKEIFKLIREYVNLGNAAIFISTELAEFLDICDRVLIIKNHTITKEISFSDVTKLAENVLLNEIQ